MSTRRLLLDLRGSRSGQKQTLAPWIPNCSVRRLGSLQIQRLIGNLGEFWEPSLTFSRSSRKEVRGIHLPAKPHAFTTIKSSGNRSVLPEHPAGQMRYSVALRHRRTQASCRKSSQSLQH